MTTFQSEHVMEETRKGAVEGVEAGAVFGAFGAGFGAGWGAALGYLNGVSRSMTAGDYSMMWMGSGRDE
jgi:hypothetical protein